MPALATTARTTSMNKPEEKGLASTASAPSTVAAAVAPCMPAMNCPEIASTLAPGKRCRRVAMRAAPPRRGAGTSATTSATRDVAGAPATSRVALVVADVPAPRLGGAARIATLRQRFPGAKVLAISGQFMAGMHGATAAATVLGADAVLAKPFSSGLFIEVVRAVVASAGIGG